MVNQVFTGGHFHSGTRVIQMLLKQFYPIHSENETLDYEPGQTGSESYDTFPQRVLEGERPKFPTKYGDKRRRLGERFAIKVPDYMLIFPYLKRLFPKSKSILLVRNGLDQVTSENRAMSVRFERYFDLPLIHRRMTPVEYFKREMKFWNDAYKRAVKTADLVIRLEDLVEHTEDVVYTICAELDIPFPDTSMIKKPESIGRHKKELVLKDIHNIRPPLIEELHYTPDYIPELIKVGREMMYYFEYDY